jgi:hypothetical protein
MVAAGFEGDQSGSYVEAFDAATGQGIFGAIFRKPSSALAFSPDGRVLAVGDDSGPVHLLYTPNKMGGAQRKLPFWSGTRAITALAYLPGGIKVAVADGGKAVRLLDASNGKEEAAFGGDDAIWALTVSLDGKWVATAGKGGEVRLWGVASGMAERRFEAALGGIKAVTFAPDGKKLATLDEDGRAVVWNLARDEKPLPRDLKLTEKELATLWDDLASNQGDRAYTALRTLRADPTRSVPFLHECLKPRDAVVDEKKLKQLTADLDADSFETREKATQELEKLGKTAESALRQALAAGPSLEATRRLERLLNALGNQVMTPEQMRDVRAVRVLEQAGTPEAKAVLEALAKESPGWWVTQEARAALERLAQSGKKP